MIRLGGLTAEAAKVVSRERKEEVAPAVGFEPTIRLGGLTADLAGEPFSAMPCFEIPLPLQGIGSSRT